MNGLPFYHYVVAGTLAAIALALGVIAGMRAPGPTERPEKRATHPGLQGIMDMFTGDPRTHALVSYGRFLRDRLPDDISRAARDCDLNHTIVYRAADWPWLCEKDLVTRVISEVDNTEHLADYYDGRYYDDEPYLVIYFFPHPDDRRTIIRTRNILKEY